MNKLQKQTTTADVVIMDGAVVCGDVTLGKGCSVWFNAVVRTAFPLGKIPISRSVRCSMWITGAPCASARA